MCLLLYKPANVTVSKERLFNSFTNNQDGAGFALLEKDEKDNPELNIYKGLFEWKEFWKEWEPRQDKQAIVHFRNASPRQAITGQNTHPFRILPAPNDLVMAHNGYIYGLPQEDIDKFSDTAIFVEKILTPLANKHNDFWLMPEFKWFLEHSIGSNNKLVMMDIKGRYAIFHESQGKWVDGSWFSNNDFNFRNYNWWEDDGDSDLEQAFEQVDNHEVHGPQNEDTAVDVEININKAKTRNLQVISIEDAPQKESVEIERQFSPLELDVLDKLLEKENARR